MTLRDILNESSVSKELISAGTGKEIARTGFEQHHSFPEHYEIQMVRNTDGTYDVYFQEGTGFSDPYKRKECYIGSIDKKVNRFQAWHDAQHMCYKSDKVPKKCKQHIKDFVNRSINMDRYDRDINFKEID